MGKKKSNSRAKRKEDNIKKASQDVNLKNKPQNTEQEASKKNSDAKNDKKQDIKTTDSNNEGKTWKYEPQQSPKMTAYTVIAMLTSLVSSGVMVLAMVVLGRPIYYAIETYFGDNISGEWHGIMTQIVESYSDTRKFNAFIIIAAAALAVAAILSLIAVSRTLKPENKPVVTLSVISLVLGAVALVSYFIASDSIFKELDLLEFESAPKFTLYKVYMVVLIVNEAMQLVNIFGVLSGKSKWKKDGKTY